MNLTIGMKGKLKLIGGISMNSRELRDETISICLNYRSISIIVLTAVYILTLNTNITYSKVFIILGMLLSSTMGTFLYKTKYSDNNVVILVIILESIAYSIFIILSGGFSSPYLWYFINLFIIIIALEPFGKHSKLMAFSLVFIMFLCILIQRRISFLNNNSITYSDINIGIAFLVVTCGFYLLLENTNKLIQNELELYELNSNLEVLKRHSEYALDHTMDVYNSLNLFSITNPQKVMDELNLTLYGTIAKNGCALFKINSMMEIELFSSENIIEEHRDAMFNFIIKTIRLEDDNVLPDELEIENKIYNIEYIKNSSEILAILFIANENEGRDEKYYDLESSFYLYLVKIIMGQLETQAIIESYIISEERNRIGSEIHDTVIQKLFFICCNVKILETQVDTLEPKEISIKLKDILKSTESAMKILREAIYGIKWDPSGEDMFENKLSTYAQEAMNMNDIDIQLNLDENLSILSANKKTSLYRIICESINNSIRHGKATEIYIDVVVNNEEVTASIQDNGKGFDKNNIPRDRQGIKNMYMIAGVLKGSLNINSELGKGTKISCTIPA